MHMVISQLIILEILCTFLPSILYFDETTKVLNCTFGMLLEYTTPFYVLMFSFCHLAKCTD